ncbi:hypothetical protein C6497_01260 [Candidatus Poribacteria bacterium]|nr:MAG: hypothetical protein C6497_01260 [Candidatus Poribacteria bacterium]
MYESIISEESIQELTEIFVNTPLPIIMGAIEQIDDNEIAVFLLILDKVSSEIPSDESDVIHKALTQSEDDNSRTEEEKTLSTYAQQILAELPFPKQVKVSEKIAATEMVESEHAGRIWNDFTDKIKSVLENTLFFGSGAKNLAKLLEQVDIEKQNKLMEVLQDRNPELAQTVGDYLFTFEDIVDIPNEAVLTVLQVVEPNTLAIALHDTTEPVVEKFYENMSTEQIKNVESETKKLSFEQKQISNTAQQSIVNLLRNFAGRGILKLR